MATMRRVGLWLLGVAALCGCSASDEEPGAGADADADAAAVDAGLDADEEASADAAAEADALPPAPCPDDMVLVEASCIDRFEAPNRAGEPPLVMYSFVEAEAWCELRGKRLCFDDEWTRGCAGAAGSKYPYGDTHQPGICNDDETWKLYDQAKLDGWPLTVSKPGVESLAELLAAARAVSVSGQIAADHVEWLYQGEPSGDNVGCAGPDGVYDLTGNVEEWTRRRDGGGGPQFSGNLKGRYWAEARTCQGNVTTHGDGFRFYEIGFRCCQQPSR